jgi:hypothetical protein
VAYPPGIEGHTTVLFEKKNIRSKHAADFKGTIWENMFGSTFNALNLLYCSLKKKAKLVGWSQLHNCTLRDQLQM